ncbi:MAG: DUF924 domain-containing protein [Rhodocyclaceae bacterium]|nr:DUF924 domain-containing protein [Rhodocyclaceae bacterium]
MNAASFPVPTAARAVLDFWFGPADPFQGGQFRREWFSKSDAFDAEIRENFGAQVVAALAGELTEWNATAEGALAHILLLDQFTRNIFRDTARAFAGDALALGLATSLVASGRDKNLPPIWRWFAFMPFEHSEALIDQERSVALFAGLCREGQHEVFDAAYEYALRHRAVIERFGRFPHRNALIGRASTAEEIEALTLPEYHF